MRKILAFAVAAAMSLALFAACTPEDLGYKIYLDNAAVTATIEIGLGSNESVILSLKDKDGKGVEDEITWSSSAASVATVSNYGTVLGKAFGETKITAKVGKSSFSCDIKVIPKLSLDKETVSLLPPGDGISEENTTATLVATSNPENQTITWTSADPSIATVSAGVITAVKVGQTKVTASYTSSGKTATAECVVKVTDAEDFAKINVTVDASAAIKGLGLTELEDWMGVYIVGSVFGWAGLTGVPSDMDGFGEGHKLTPVAGKEFVFSGEFNFDLTKTVTDEETGEVSPAYARNVEYKYVIAGYRAEEAAQYNYQYEAYNGSNVDNRKMFLNGNMTVTDTVTVFQGMPVDPAVPPVDYTVQFDIYFANELLPTDTVAIVGGFGVQDGEFWWKPDGGPEGALLLVKDAANAKKYSVTFVVTTKSQKTPEFKIAFNGSWDGEYKGDIYTGTEKVEANKLTGNAVPPKDLPADSAATVVHSYFLDNPAAAEKEDYTVTFNIRLATPLLAGETLVMRGAAPLSWEGTTALTATEGVYTTTVTFSSTGLKTTEFKFFIADSEDGRWIGGSSIYLGTTKGETAIGGDNLQLTLSAATCTVDLFIDNAPAA